jgi:hypothetical protein
MLGLLALFGWAFVRHPNRRAMQRCLLLVTTVATTLLLSDWVLRTALRHRFHYRPHEMFVRRWPPLPEVTRYAPRVRYTGRTHGDLAAMSHQPSLREPRQITFNTDPYGFPNRHSQHDRALDLILLGDSFGVGAGTPQESTWAELLESQHGLRTYNLSLPGSPSHSYLNLLIEGPRLRLQPGTVVLLAVFAGNDFFEEYHEFETAADLPWRHTRARIIERWVAWRERSAIRQLWDGGWYPHHAPSGSTTPASGDVLARRVLDDDWLLFYKPYAWINTLSDTQSPLPALLAPFERTVDRLQRYCQTHQLQLELVLIPTKEEVYQWALDHSEPWSTPALPSQLGRALAQLCAEREIGFLDLKPGMITASRNVYTHAGQFLFWRDDTHWNEHGHRWVADRVFHHLQR